MMKEFMLVGSHQQLSKVSIPHVTIGNSTDQARNLGTIFDYSMSLHYNMSMPGRNDIANNVLNRG